MSCRLQLLIVLGGLFAAGPLSPSSALAGDTLAPSWEAERLSNRPVDTDSAKFVPGKGLEFKSADGDFLLQTRLRAQFLYSGTVVPDEDYSHDFMIRRARLQFAGNM